MDTKKILLFLARGFEDLEAVTVIDICGWTYYRKHLQKVDVSVAGFRRVVQGRFGTKIDTDVLEQRIVDFHQVGKRNKEYGIQFIVYSDCPWGENVTTIAEICMRLPNPDKPGPKKRSGKGILAQCTSFPWVRP